MTVDSEARAALALRCSCSITTFVAEMRINRISASASQQERPIDGEETCGQFFLLPGIIAVNNEQGNNHRKSQWQDSKSSAKPEDEEY